MTSDNDELRAAAIVRARLRASCRSLRFQKRLKTLNALLGHARHVGFDGFLTMVAMSAIVSSVAVVPGALLLLTLGIALAEEKLRGELSDNARIGIVCFSVSAGGVLVHLSLFGSNATAHVDLGAAISSALVWAAAVVLPLFGARLLHSRR